MTQGPINTTEILNQPLDSEPQNQEIQPVHDPKLSDNTNVSPQDNTDRAKYQQLVGTSLMLMNPDVDTNGTPYIWAAGLEKGFNYLDDDGKPVAGAVGNLIIYGIPSELYEDRNSPYGLVLNNCLLRPRAIGGLYDFVPVDQHQALLTAFGIKREDVPAPTYVVQQLGNANKDRLTARKQRNAARQVARAMEGGANAAVALLKLQQGNGVMEGGGVEAQGALAVINQMAKMNIPGVKAKDDVINQAIR